MVLSLDVGEEIVKYIEEEIDSIIDKDENNREIEVSGVGPRYEKVVGELK